VNRRQDRRQPRPALLARVLLGVLLAAGVAMLPAAPARASVTNPSCGWTTAWHGPLPTSSSYFDLRWFASQLNDRCRLYYPQIVQRLASASLPEWHPRDSITFVFETGRGIYATAATGIVHLGMDHFNDYPHDWGAVIHEMTHVAGNYPGGQPAFVVEGIADAVRFSLGGSYQTSGLESPDRARCPSDENYIFGYGCAAALLAYVEDVYHQEAVRTVHALGVRNEGYRYPNVLYQLTGRSVDTLWAECLHYERWCNNGR
jgi:Peptidase of plants and bacteria